MSYYGYFKPSRPIETDKGIKAHSKRGDFAANWWAQRWIKALERITDSGRLTRGRSYARRGQVLSIAEKKGTIQAKVQGSRSTPYKITIRVAPFTDHQWEAVIDALAERAFFTAQLLAGEMPQEIEDAFAAAGVSLFPTRSGELETECSCPDWANPCKHVAATHYILGEQFDEEPFLLFRLRGRSQQEVLAALRERRESGLVLTEEPAAYEVPQEETPPLADLLESFWQLQHPLDHFPMVIREPVTPHPVLRRLGQPAFLDENLESLLGPAYDHMTQAALRMAFAGERAGEAE